uniref:Heparan-sulfate 6-O-sulfotransferase n=1 Tax=Ditylenchus dipsaci TaxID=166011 RepID=A0A915D8P7_9BILA
MAVVLYNRVFPTSSTCFKASKKVYLCLSGEQGASNYTAASLHLTTRYSLEQMKDFAFKNTIANNFKPSLYVRNLSFNRIFEDVENRFDIEGDDVISPCECITGGKKRCNCFRPKSNSKESWLFSRYSTGWACGLHADFTELTSGCVDKVMDKKEEKHNRRRYYYTTFLRDPVERFVSEYSHVERGATWLSARHVCNGHWVGGVELNEFISCPFNLAFNRQTRMLADLTLVNCYNRSSMEQSTRDGIMLESAKTNLRNLAFFGIKERMNDSQLLFEKVFDMRFTRSMGVWNKSKSQNTVVTPAQLAVIRERNHLDIELYKFAVKLFEKRLRTAMADQSYDQEQADLLRSPFDTNAEKSITMREELPTISSTSNSELHSSANHQSLWSNKTSQHKLTKISTLKSLLKAN